MRNENAPHTWRNAMTITRRDFTTGSVLLAGAIGLGSTRVQAADIAAAEARAIAKEAYIYGFPMVDNYRIQYAYFEDSKSPEYKAPWNQLINIPRVYTPADTAIQTPNSDTPYSWLGIDPARRTHRAHRAADRKGTVFQIQFICANCNLLRH